MTREEAALILQPDMTISALEKWDNSSYEARIALVEEACRMGAEALRDLQPDAEVDDNFEPWLPNSRNQRCILPLINLLLNE